MSTEVKAFLYSMCIIIIGFLLLSVPIVSIVVKFLIGMIVFMYIYEDMWDYVYEEEQKDNRKKKGI